MVRFDKGEEEADKPRESKYRKDMDRQRSLCSAAKKVICMREVDQKYRIKDAGNRTLQLREKSEMRHLKVKFDVKTSPEVQKGELKEHIFLDLWISVESLNFVWQG